jgi:hypothetical protein
MTTLKTFRFTKYYVVKYYKNTIFGVVDKLNRKKIGTPLIKHPCTVRFGTYR